MDALELVVRGTDKAVAYACAKCGIVHGQDPTGKRFAEECCDRKCSGCGVQIGKSWLQCEACRRVAEIEREAKRFEAAKKFTEAEYDGPVYDHKADRYYASVDELRVAYEDDGDALPAYVYACTTHPFEILADRIVEDAIESLELEDDDPSIPEAMDELESFVKSWNAKQSFVSWTQNTREAVVLNG